MNLVQSEPVINTHEEKEPMFSDDSERIIPRKPINSFQTILQVVVILILIFFSMATLFLPQLPGWLSRWQSVIFPAMMIGVVVLMLGNIFYESWRVRRNWASFAEEMGFRYEPSSGGKGPSIQGNYRSHRFVLTQFTERRGRNQVHYTSFAVPLNNTLKHTLAMRPKKITDIRRELTGDDEVDRRLTISTSSKQMLQYLLRTRRIRLGMMQLAERNRGMQLHMDKTTLRLVMRGRLVDQEYLKTVLTYLTELAGAMERYEQIGR
ncbi:MAG: hypothetical protein P8046_06525 [Anaerolineales bacterium]